MRLFVTFFCLFGAFSLSAQAALLAEFHRKWENATAYTLEVAEAMPDSLFGYQPTAEQMSFRDQLLHMAGNMLWLSVDKLGYQPEDGFDWKARHEAWQTADLNKAEAINALTTALNVAKRAAASLTPEDLDAEVSFFAGPMSKRQILTLLNDHHTHHRAQIIVYLRLQGLQPPRYRGW